MKIYLDNCCYNRPFDDRSQTRINLESEAVLAILRNAQLKKDLILGSDILELEMDRIHDPVKRQKVKALYKVVSVNISYNDAIANRAKDIMSRSKIRSFDSMHIAAAEYAKADVLLTTDDKLEKMAANIELKVRILNPLRFVMEVY